MAPPARSSTRGGARPRALRAAFGTLALAGAALATAVAATARHTHWGEILVNLSAYLGALALVAGLVLAVDRRWRRAGLALGLATWHALPVAALFVGAPATPDRPAAGPAVRLASVNLHYENEDAARFLAWLDAEDPDVLGLLEVTPFWARVLGDLAARYPHRVAEPLREDAFAMQLLSRHPLRDAELRRTPHAYRAWIEAEVDVPGGALHVVLAHPSRPGRGWGTEERNAYLVQLADEIDWRPGSVLFGDLNATVWSPAYGDVLDATGLADSRRGFGWLPSWRSQKYVAGIWLDLDHILVGRGVRVLERRVGPDVGSDHRPAVALLELPGAAATPEHAPVEASGRRARELARGPAARAAETRAP